ncbi:MAG: hypothetical protein FWF77_08125 [Defluviitaleaceae bacterium]|nr:hypothetical protein [Defluviitaleaceae bacterium]
MSRATHSLEAVSSFGTGDTCRRRHIPSKPEAVLSPWTCVGGDTFPRSREQFRHQGHMSRATHSLEAVSNFLAHKKKSRRVSLADSFFSIYILITF